MDQERGPLSVPAPPKGRGLAGTPRLGLIAVAAGLFVLIVGTSVESAIIALTHPSTPELQWVSDAVAAAAVCGLTYLWLHLKAARTRVSDLERGRIALEEQLRLAAQIQRSLLPEVPPRTPGFRWAARMIPAGYVGGDFYDFVVGDDGSVLVILGDISGKGIPAALLQASVKTLFRIQVASTTDLAQVAARMSEALRGETGGLPYATAILARFQSAPCRMSYVNAGHPNGLLLREGRCVELHAGGPPLGLLAEGRYEQAEQELLPGEVGVFVTDGITEALEGVPLSLAQALQSGAGSDGQPATICERLLRISGDAPGPPGVEGWQDDRTVLVFRVDGHG